MAEIAPKLIELSADKLRALHERLHKSEATPEVLEVHHLAINEMLRRGLEAPQNDVWDEFEILVDTMKQANLKALAGSLPAEMIEDVIKSTGSAVADVQLFLTTTGYEMRLEKSEELHKMIRNENGKYTVYDEEGKRRFGTYNTKAEAEERLAQMHQFKKADDSYTPPKAVRAAARRALDWIADGKAGSGFTGVGRGRASQLAAGESISLATLKRMKSFFSRHEVDKNALGFSQGEKGFPSPGRVAWDAWGGDAGFAWAESMVAQAEKEVSKHNPGMHDQKTHGSWADDIAQDILDGKHPRVEAKNVSAFLMAAAKRTDHPDLTELSVDGTLLFGDEGMGIPRKEMPQIPGKERARFLKEIEESEGITAEKEKVDPTTLKPIQKEISSARSGAIYNKFREDGSIPKDERILISSDGFVVDGHHTWGASVAFAFDNPGTELPVYRLSVTAEEALSVSREWATANGFEGQAIDAPAKKSKFVWKHLEGQHDQNAHGSWAGASNKSLPLIEDTKPERNRTAGAVQAATRLRDRILSVEPQITGLMQDLAKMSDGQLVGLEYRVKSTDSLARKIDADSGKDYNGDYQKAAENISDAIRYTMTMPDDEYTAGADRAIKALESAGFKLRTKNFWQTGDPYDGANIKATKDGITVEVQLHTPRSFKAKESQLHPIYEQYRVETNETSRQGYWSQMVDIARSIPRPTNMATLLTMGTLVVQEYETARQAGLIKSTPVGKMSWNLERGIAVCVIS
jgi:hypothetical protein